MKKLLSLILALTLVLSMSVPALAAGDNRATQITATVGEAYTIVIPENLAITSASTNLGIQASALNILPTNKLAVTATANGTLAKTGAPSTTLAYTLKEGANAFNGLDFTAPETQNVTVDITDWAIAAAGTYTGTVTFNVAIAPIA